MKKIIVILSIILLAFFVGFICGNFFSRQQKQEVTRPNQGFIFRGDFLSRQLKYERVKDAFENKKNIILQNLNNSNIKSINIIIVAYKSESILEIYAKSKQDSIYQKIISYPICSRSGKLGPKRQSGDNQVPEGFYYIDRFNPRSKFFLSLGIDYPNNSDKIKSKAQDLGGDIFIHGSCKTEGCIPMTDDKIKEIYMYAVFARNNGQTKIPVYIFPFRMNSPNWENYKRKYLNNKELFKFWENLRIGYIKFEKNKRELGVTIDINGEYKFK